jgi:hypothetical protein
MWDCADSMPCAIDQAQGVHMGMSASLDEGARKPQMYTAKTQLEVTGGRVNRETGNIHTCHMPRLYRMLVVYYSTIAMASNQS